MFRVLSEILVAIRDDVRFTGLSSDCMAALAKPTIHLQTKLRQLKKECSPEHGNFTDGPYIESMIETLNVIIHRLLVVVVSRPNSHDNDQLVLYNLNKACSDQFRPSWTHEKDPSEILAKSDDKICVVCLDELTEDSNIAVLDSCDHLMCASCAQLTLMGDICTIEIVRVPGFIPVTRAVTGKLKRCPYCASTVSHWSTSAMIKTPNAHMMSRILNCKPWPRS